MEERRAIFETMPVPKAVLKLAVPTIISQLITMVYSLADTLFVGMMGDPAQVAAVTLAWPAFMLLTVLAHLFGIGGGSYISRLIGVRKYGEAASVASFCFYSALGLALIYSLAVLFFCETVSGWLGADAENLKFTCDYLKWVVCVGTIPTVGNLLLAHLVRAEGASKAAGFGMSLGGVLNIILDPIFILPWGLNLQVAGAAMATALSNGIACVYFLIYITAAKKTKVITLRLSIFGFAGRP
jgi:Na+-driven multidrug efflux pump